MNRAVLAFGLAGFAAAGATSILAFAPVAPGGRSAADKVQCDPGSHPGQAVQKTELVKVNQQRIKAGRVYLKKGAIVTTTDHGTAKVCLQLGGTVCDLDAETRLRVFPPADENALAVLTSGSVTCTTQAGKSVDKYFETSKQTIRLGALGLSSAGLAERGDTAAGEGHLFSLSVRKGGGAVVKVGRGATVVGRRSDLAGAVVLGRRQQVAVPGGKEPGRPKPLTLTSKERRAFNQLGSALPPVQDTKGPDVGIADGPSEGSSSSLRTPKFTFAATEDGSIFSCSIDGGPFRLCLNPQRLPALAPGAHTLTVIAADPTGNVTDPKSAAKRSWTVDDSMIAFTSERDGNREIYVMDPGGGHLTRLTNQPGEDGAPAWLPDRSRIAFHSERDGNFEIYVMSANGANQTDLTKNPAFDKNPTWSPDGRQIAFESGRDGNSEIYVMNADGTKQRRLTFNDAVDFDPAWSPDGSRIAFASNRDGNYEIYVMNADGSNPVRLTDDPAIEFNPAWSPDGEQIAFHSDRGPPRESSQIFVMNADGTGVTRITFTRANDYNPVWAPDGHELAFQSDRVTSSGGTGPGGDYEIYVVNADGQDQDLLRLTDAPQADLTPDWSRAKGKVAARTDGLGTGLLGQIVR